MKRACILYTRADAERSRVLINKYSAALKAHGLTPSVTITDRLPYGEVLRSLHGTELIINRTRDAGLAKFLEEAGFFVSNPSELTRVANDKFLTYELLHGRVPMLETGLLTGEAPPLPYPFVVKPAAGHGGAGVTLVHDRAELARYRGSHPEKSVYQALCPTLGRDMRVYVIGGRPRAAVMRASDSDFRSNFTLGGRAEPMDPNSLLPEQLKIIERVSEALPLHYAGVDIMPCGGGWVLNEIEDPVGARMLYIHTGLDPAAEHVKYLIGLFQGPPQNTKTI